MNLFIVCTAFAVLMVAGFHVLLSAVKSASVGYQDENGFHFGK